MNTFCADLHCHSSCSDGNLSPTELLHLAKKKGLKGLSITDHDTAAAYPEIIPLAQSLGILIGTGVEFSCFYQGRSVHVLGYDYRLDSEEFQALCQRHFFRRSRRNQGILEKLKGEGILISETELEEQSSLTESVGRPHIAQLMIKKGYVKDMKEAFNRYLAEGKKGYVPGETISLEETIEVIHAAGGKAFLAHPHIIYSASFLRALLELQWDGLEAYYALFPPQENARWVQLAEKKGWLVSGGSDFHGKTREDISLGSATIGEETFYQIFSRPL